MIDRSRLADYLAAAFQTARIVDDIPADTAPIPVKKVGVVGPSTIGGGIEMKKDIIRRLDHMVKPGTILATNTSGLDVNAIAAVTGRTDAVIGISSRQPMS